MVISNFPFLYLCSVADAQFVTFKGNGSNTPKPFQTNSSVSFQVNLATRIICASANSTFQREACSDPDRVEVLVVGVTEVRWFREKSKKNDKKEKKNDARTEIHTCRSDSFSHSISGLNASFKFVGFSHQLFEIHNSSEMMNVSSVELSWNLKDPGQAPGALLTFNILFFTQNATIIFEDQMVDVFNGTVKTSYEVNFDFS